MSKKAIIDIIEINQTIRKLSGDERLTDALYHTRIKPMMDSFERAHGKSVNLYLRNYLDHLTGLERPFEIKMFLHRGRVIHDLLWSTYIYKYDSKRGMPASFSPQLYVQVNAEGLKFGFDYGDSIDAANEMVQEVKVNDFLIQEVIKSSKTIQAYLLGSGASNLPSEDQRIILDTAKKVKDNWSNGIHLINQYRKNEIPENIDQVISATLETLLPLFKHVCLIGAEGDQKPGSNLFSQPKRAQNNANTDFSLSTLIADLKKTGLQFSNDLVTRFASSLLSKKFVILTGLSGSGKTKLAQTFAKWLIEDEEQLCIVPVGADWTNRDPLLGYANGLIEKNYVKPENGALDLLLAARNNLTRPYFLILDEMNLSHVERYFADFLSAIESEEKIALHPGSEEWDNVPSRIQLSNNLFIIGTVNIDETTYMFSPKVLDRAHVIEFRVSAEEIKNFLTQRKEIDVNAANHLGVKMAQNFIKFASGIPPKRIGHEINQNLLTFFDELKKCGAEFGYRSAGEIIRFCDIVRSVEPSWSIDKIVDAAIMQKLLPKLHGSRRKLDSPLHILGRLCLIDPDVVDSIFTSADANNLLGKAKYPLSFEKIWRMYRGIVDNGFASYADV